MTWPFSRAWRIVLASGAVVCALAILGVMVYRERTFLLNYDWNLRWQFIIYGFFLLAGGMACAAGVWAGIMHALGSKVAYRDHFRYYIISQLAKRLPGTVWYVASRGLLYRQHGESARLVALASTLELLISVISGALVALALAGGTITQLPGVQWVAMLTTIVVGAAVTHPTVLGWILRRMGQANTTPIAYRALLRWLGVYILLWIMGGMILLCMANAVTVVAPSDAAFVIGSWCLVGVLSMLVIFLPSNLGFTEVGISFLLATIMPASVAVIVAILMRIAMLIYELISAGIFMGVLRLRKHYPPKTGVSFESDLPL